MSEGEIRSVYLDRYMLPSLVGGGVLLALVIIGGIFNNWDMFFRAWLFAWFFWLGVPLGALAVIMLHHMTGGGWGYLVRRFGEAAAVCVPVMAVLFIPILIGYHYVYPWADPHFAHDAVVQHKAAWLNFPLWFVRFLIYFAAFFGLAWVLRVTSLATDGPGDVTPLHVRFNRVSAGGIVAYFVLMTLGAIDWVMSRDPHWYSTVFGFLICIGQSITGVCFLIMLLGIFSRNMKYASVIRPNYLNDLGNVLLTFVILWAYLGLSQFLIIWLGDIQHEIEWYIRRTDHGWRWVGGILIAFHFLVPFILLLQRPLKRKIARLVTIAAFMFFIHILDVLFIVTATGHDTHSPGWWVLAQLMNLGAWLGIGGVFVGCFTWVLRRAPILPMGERIHVVLVDHAHGQQPASQAV